MRVLELDCKLEMKDFGISACFEGGFGRQVLEMITKEEEQKLKELVKEITDMVSKALVREVRELENKATDETNELFDKIPEELKNMLDEAEEKFKSLKTSEEKIKFTMELLGKALAIKEK